MKNKILVSALLLTIILLGSCEKDNIESNIDPIYSTKSEFKILFQYEYTNSAWGHSHSGWFLDNQGNIRGYDWKYEVPIDWQNEDNQGYIEAERLISNYNQTYMLRRDIDLNKFYDLSTLIEGTINGKLSKLDCRGADIGKMGFYCFFWDKEKNKFKKQLLAITGDCDQINITAEAVQLTEYLNQVMSDDPIVF